MEEISVYHALFLQLSATFSNFLLAGGHDPLFVAIRCPAGYLNSMYIDMKLVTYLLPKDARFFIHHLTRAACCCTFCEEVTQLPTLNHRVRCFRCWLQRISHSCVCSKLPTHTIPVDFSFSHGTHMVSRLHTAHVYRFINVLSAVNTINPRQEELRHKLLELLTTALQAG